MGRPNVYPYSQEKVREQLCAVLDCLFENDVDYDAWHGQWYYPDPAPGPSIREIFLGDKEYTSNGNEEFRQMRGFLLEYSADRIVR